MNCQPALIHGYADRELDAATTLRVEAHLRECEACSAAYEHLRALHAACSSEPLYFQMPPGFEGRLRAAARREVRTGFLPPTAWRPLLATAAAALVVAAVWVGVLLRSPDNAVAEQVVADHVRSLLVEGRNVDVISTDHHTVKPWLTARLDFAPDLPDVPADFHLTGGRLDYVAGRRAAAIVYQYHQHVIDVIIWPADRAGVVPPAFLQRQGYWLAHWTAAGLHHWAVCDAGEDVLRGFVDHWYTPSDKQ